MRFRTCSFSASLAPRLCQLMGSARISASLASSASISARVDIVQPFGARIERAIGEVFDLRPAAIIRDLDLLRPIYQQTAAYGHFGRELPELTWERTDRVADLKSAAGA